MGKHFFSGEPTGGDLDRIDGRLKVTGGAKYSAEYEIPGLVYGVLVSSTITKGTIKSLDTKAAERAPGVLAVLSHLNAPKVPGYDEGENPAKGKTKGKGFRVFNDNQVYFNGQPIALVVADSFERAVYAASLVKAQYTQAPHETDVISNLPKAAAPKSERLKDYKRGEVDAYKNAPFKVEQEYIVPIEVHNPMELHSIIATWDGPDKVTVYDKTQGVKDTQQSIMEAFKLPAENVQVNSKFVGGAFGSALRTWPHEIAAILAAKKTGKPVKLVLSRDQMFTMVGYRPFTVQKLGLGATKDGKFVGLTHEATSETSTYEEFTEGTVNVSKFLYACPNVNTRYHVIPLDVSTPTWMRGPGEATGTFALESAIDELSYALNIDPLELRLINYAETDPEKNLPFSSKYLKEAYLMGADKIGWKNRNPKPRSMKDGEWLVGYGLSTGTFGAYRGKASALARMHNDGTLLIRTAVSDIGPGTGTAMVKIASDTLGIPASGIRFELGDSSYPDAPTQGGSSITSSVGSAVHDVCSELKQKLIDLAAAKEGSPFKGCKPEDVAFQNGQMTLTSNPQASISVTDVMKQNNLPSIESTKDSKGGPDMKKYSFYSFSVHFVQVHVHPVTGVVRVTRVVSGADAGTIVSEKTARSQMIGGVAGGIGMALTEEGVIDSRYGRYVNNNLADYHVPVHADVPHTETFFVNKPDPYINPMGAKGMGEIALIGFAAAVANAVYHATGKRIRELPITPDKLI